MDCRSIEALGCFSRKQIEGAKEAWPSICDSDNKLKSNVALSRKGVIFLWGSCLRSVEERSLKIWDSRALARMHEDNSFRS